MTASESKKLSQLEDKITHIESTVKSLMDYHERLDEMVLEVRNALIGNSLTKDGGLVKKLEDSFESTKELKVRIEVLEQFKSRVKWTIAGVSIASGAFGFVIKELVSRIFFL